MKASTRERCLWVAVVLLAAGLLGCFWWVGEVWAVQERHREKLRRLELTVLGLPGGY